MWRRNKRSHISGGSSVQTSNATDVKQFVQFAAKYSSSSCVRQLSRRATDEEEFETCNIKGCPHMILDKADHQDHVRRIHDTGIYDRIMAAQSSAGSISTWLTDRSRHYPTREVAIAKEKKRIQRTARAEESYKRWQVASEARCSLRHSHQAVKKLITKYSRLQHSKTTKPKLRRARRLNRRLLKRLPTDVSNRTVETKADVAVVTPKSGVSPPETGPTCFGLLGDSLEDETVNSFDNTLADITDQSQSSVMPPILASLCQYSSDDEAPDEMAIVRPDPSDLETEEKGSEKSRDTNLMAPTDDGQYVSQLVEVYANLMHSARLNGGCHRQPLNRKKRQANNRPAGGSMFQAIYADVIHKETTNVLQCIKYVCQNDFFQRCG